jgi:transcriptional regulator with XRE-family HTH domain
MMTVQQAHEVAAMVGEGLWHRWPVPPDPGDLSRRLASRRAELRLSLDQVARRAGLESRYLEYLEHFAGHVDPATLRRLAAALDTTPAALLGAGLEAPAGRDGAAVCWQQGGQLEKLSRAECYQLLGPRGIGRIAFANASGLMVLPVNYAVMPANIVIRTDSGSVIGMHGDGPVSLEADQFDLNLGQGWNVLVRGDAHRVLQPGELRRLRAECDLRPWPSGKHDLFITIVPTSLSGRRIRSQ